MKQLLLAYLRSHRVVIAAMAAAAIGAAYTSLQSGHIDWRAVGMAAFAVLAGVSRSPLDRGAENTTGTPVNPHVSDAG